MEILSKYSSFLANLSQEVYFPDEDSYLLSEFVCKYSSGSVLDVGCGNGIQSFSAATNNSVTSVLGIDSNQFAIDFCNNSASKLNLQVICNFKEVDFFDFVTCNKTKFQTIICNPPYLPTSPEEVMQGQINQAFDGGIDGRQFIDRFLKEIPNIMDKNSQLLTIASSLSGITQTIDFLNSCNYTSEVLRKKSYFFEELVCIRAIKN